MKIASKCRVCNQPFRSSTRPKNPPRHCANGQCDWCIRCADEKTAQCKRDK